MDMCHFRNLILQTVIIAVVTRHLEAGICLSYDPHGETKFSFPLAGIEYVRPSKEVIIPCCATGYQKITWYRLHNKTWQRFPSALGREVKKITVEEDGQILRIFHAGKEDNTTYRCEVEGRRNISHATKVIVLNCYSHFDPHFVDPYPENKTISEYGGNLTFVCTARFSSSDCEANEEIQYVQWFIGRKQVFPQNMSRRYSVQNSLCTHTPTKYSPDSVTFEQQASLTITGVREEDTNRKFYCILATPQRHVRKTMIFMQSNETPWLKISLYIGGFVLSAVTLVIFGFVVKCLYGPQIRLFCSSRISALRPQSIDSDHYIYNLFIYHTDADKKTAQYIKRNMMNRKYEVYIAAEMKGNQSIIHTFFEKTAKSGVVLFLYSNALRADDLANFFLQSLITERKGKGIIFLEIAKYDPKDVMNWTLNTRDVYKVKEELSNKNTASGSRKETSFTESEFGYTMSISEAVANCEVEIDGFETSIAEKNEIVDDLKFWKVLPRIKLPKEIKNRRKMENFWCSLQNKVPKFVHQTCSSENEKGCSKASQRRRETKPLMS